MSGLDEPSSPPSPHAASGITDLLAEAGLDADVHLRQPEDAPPVDQGPRIGRYAFRGYLGAGGMGEVLRVYDAELQREIALKVIRHQERPSALRRFVVEARLTGQLEHPHILPVHELGVSASGEVYFTMPQVRGRTLRELLRADAADAPGLMELLQIFQKVADAVGYAHTVGVVHRDLKPGNIMIGDFGRVYLLDWGIAARLQGGHGDDDDGGKLVGTPAYMAPERLERGVDGVTRAADVYALGAVLYRILTRQAPFTGPPGVVLGKIRAGALVPPRQRAPERDVPWELDAVVLKAMAVDPAQRYPDVAALQADIQAYLEGRMLAAPEYGLLDIARRALHEHRHVVLVGTAALIALVVVGAGMWMQQVRQARVAQANLVAFRGLADIQRAQEALRATEALWPPYPHRMAAMEAWRADARGLLASMTSRRTLESGSGLTAPERDWYNTELDTLRQLEARLREEVDGVDRRLAFARDLGARSLEAPAAAWADAVRYAATHPAYRGLELTPTIGLVPLGPDPRTGLLEFADLQTGLPPERDADGKLQIGPHTGVVYVLLPGGRTTMGARPPGPGAPEGTPYTDPWAADAEPVHEVSLAPFYMSRYELTQGQWERIMGANPSFHQPRRNGHPLDPQLPVEFVSLDEVSAAVMRFAARVPTEAQWEYAARGGTSTIWWTGDDPADVARAGNLDAASTGVAGWDDGADGILVVGQLAPNPFGLHDVIGNVYEWTRDGWHPFAYSLPVLPGGDAERDVPERTAYVARGASYMDGLEMSRSAARMRTVASARFRGLGVRPSRDLEDGTP